MNAPLPPPAPADLKLWYSAQEIADAAKRLAVGGVPTTKRGIAGLIVRGGWDTSPDTLSRPRAGREGGGGREYHFDLLPAALRAALDAEYHRALTAAAAAVHVAAETEKRVAVRSAAGLNARQRQVMEARAAILTAIDHFRILHALSERAAILAFGARPEDFGVADATVVVANDRLTDDRSISARTVQRWMQRRKAGGIAALAPVATREPQPLPPGFATFLTHYLKPQKPAVTEALDAYRKTNPAHPLTYKQVRYTLDTKLTDIERNRGRDGILALRARLPYVDRSTEALFPTTIYVADGKTFDAEIAHPVSKKPFKPEITTIEDVATRRIVGRAVSAKENVIAVTEALRVSCIRHGIPAIFYTDRGPGYKNKTFDTDYTGLLGRLSITPMRALPYGSQAKGLVERVQKTIWNRLARTYPTYLGKDMDKEAAKGVHKATRRDIKAFGSSRLLPDFADFLTAVDEAIAEYNARPHSELPRVRDEETGTLRHYSPDEFWAKHVADGFEAVPVDVDERDDLFRPYEIRVARRGLVEWNTNTYFHAALEGWHGRKVCVGYDFGDGSRVWVRHYEKGADQPGALICVAVFAGNSVDYVPRSMQRAAEEKRLRGQESRLHRRLQDKREELNPGRFLEHVPAVPVAINPAPMAEPESVAAVEPAPVAPRRQVFASDEELALWALANPEKLTAGQRKVLSDCLSRQTSRDYLRLSGVNVEALYGILRAAA